MKLIFIPFLSPLQDGLVCGLILAMLTALSKVRHYRCSNSLHMYKKKRKKEKSEVDGWMKG